MKTLKKLIYILTIALAGMALLASCSKEAEPQKAAKKGKKAPPVAAVSPTDAKHTFTAIREGQNVTLRWVIDPAGEKISKFYIMRNATGIDKKRTTVCGLESNVTSFKDSLPDKNACWYWLRVTFGSNKYKDIGPVMVGPDKQETANYTKPEDNYKVVVTRTDEVATLKWEFPEDQQYQLIQIARYPRPVTEMDRGVKNVKITSLAGKSQASDALPDPDSDYWYWFRIRLQSGVVIYKGPIKAEYAKKNTKN